MLMCSSLFVRVCVRVRGYLSCRLALILERVFVTCGVDIIERSASSLPILASQLGPRTVVTLEDAASAPGAPMKASQAVR